MREKAVKKNLTLDKTSQQVVRGNATKMGGGKYEVLTGMDFCLLIPADEWNQWTDTQRRYVVDTYLSQMQGEEDSTTGDMKWFTVPFPVSFFPEVVDRYGMPFDELRDGLRSMRAADEASTRQICATRPNPSQRVFDN